MADRDQNNSVKEKIRQVLEQWGEALDEWFQRQRLQPRPIPIPIPVDRRYRRKKG